MIAGIEGTLESHGTDWAIIKLNGISLKVHSSASTLGQLGALGENVRLHTHLIAREDNVSLYGFISQEELNFFIALISVDGIGPKLALSMLSGMSVEQLSIAIATGDANLLTRLPGLGKKTAGRLVLELKDKVGNNLVDSAPAYLVSDNAAVVEALTSLGYSISEATRALTVLPASSDATLEEKIRLALQQLAAR